MLPLFNTTKCELQEIVCMPCRETFQKALSFSPSHASKSVNWLVSVAFSHPFVWNRVLVAVKLTFVRSVNLLGMDFRWCRGRGLCQSDWVWPGSQAAHQAREGNLGEYCIFGSCFRKCNQDYQLIFPCPCPRSGVSGNLRPVKPFEVGALFSTTIYGVSSCLQSIQLYKHQD